MLDHTQLQIWQRSMALSLAVDRALLACGPHAPPGLASQLSRACASIAANIAEGAGQNSPAQTARFLDIATGSISETQNHITRAAGLGLIPCGQGNAFNVELTEIRRMTIAFRNWVAKKSLIPSRSNRPKSPTD
jgi:four helix bundle protein